MLNEFNESSCKLWHSSFCSNSWTCSIYEMSCGKCPLVLVYYRVMALYRDLFTSAVWPNPGHEAEPSDLDLATQHKWINPYCAITILLYALLVSPHPISVPTPPQPLPHPHRPHPRGPHPTLTKFWQQFFFSFLFELDNFKNFFFLRVQYHFCPCNITFQKH